MQRRALQKLLARIDHLLQGTKFPENQPTTPFEAALDDSLGILSESLDAFVNLAHEAWSIETPKFMQYLQHAPEEEVMDWVNALEIVVVEQEELNRWTLGLAQETSKLPLSPRAKTILAGVLEALNAADWSENPTV